MKRRLLAWTDAWLRKTATEESPRHIIAEALARPAPETPDGKVFIPPGGVAPTGVN